MTQPPITLLRPVGAEHARRPLGWFAVVSAMFSLGVLLALYAPWGSLSPSLLWPMLAAACTWLLCAWAQRVPPVPAWIMRLAPWAGVLLLGGFWLRDGIFLWINCILNNWNILHDDGLALLDVSAAARSVMAASMLAAVAAGQLSWHITAKRRLLAVSLIDLVLLLLQLINGVFSPLSCALLLSAYLLLWMSEPEKAPSAAALRLSAFCAALLCLAAVFSPKENIAALDTVRKDVSHTVHTLRYGDDTLPEGKLDRAAMLGTDRAPALTVSVSQEKALYLRGYVGVNYADSVWSPLPGSAYAGNYSGMLTWLRNRGFDPITQVTTYYSLCTDDEAPAPNRVSVAVSGAQRSYVYLPISSGQTLPTARKSQRDTRLLPGGFTGAKSYFADERSPYLPAELTTTAAWVTSPQTDAQAQYAQAESVYRAFVYDTYTTATPSLLPQINEFFWQDYAPEHDSVYQAVCHIRDCLSVREKTAVRQSDPISRFLSGYGRSSALYASAAVQALRAHGIPARYVEGYYLSASEAALAGGHTIDLTGQNTHAWTEIYFDGVGWLPVDFTPGYYYDARTLQQLIAAPDSLRKTAALASDREGSELSDSPAQSDAVPEDETSPVSAIGRVLLGLLAVLILIATAFFILTELAYYIIAARDRFIYHHAAPERKAALLRSRIFDVLAARGFDACLGWDAEALDAQLAAAIPAVSAGEFRRAVSLMEKSQYGGQTLTPAEMRTLHSFLRKLCTVTHPVLDADYWRVRYLTLLHPISPEQTI